MNKRLLYAGLLVCLACSSAYCADWPAFRGPYANGFSPETGISKSWNRKSPSMLWKINLRDDGFAGPSVANGLLYIIDHRGQDDSVRAIRMSDGKGIWQYKYPEPGGSNYGYSRSTPTVKAGKVYIVSRSGKLFCLDAKNGKLLWFCDLMKTFNGRTPTWNHAWSPIVDGNKLIVLPGGPNAAVAALDAATGKRIWQGGGSDTPGYSTPVKANINGKPQYVVFMAYHLIGVDAANGRLLWAYPWKTDNDVNAAMPLVIGNKVFITSDYGKGCALVEISPDNRVRLLWKNTQMQSHFSSPVTSKGYIYGTTDPGDLVCLRVSDGKAMWRHPGFEKGGVCAVDGTIIAVNGAGGDVVMVQLAPQRYQELGRFVPLGGQSWTAPIIANKRLIIRNKNTLACFAL